MIRHEGECPDCSEAVLCDGGCGEPVEEDGDLCATCEAQDIADFVADFDATRDMEAACSR